MEVEAHMITYRITNVRSGFCIGSFEGNTPADALDAYARDAGYANFAECCDVTESHGADLDVVAVEEGT